MNDSFAAAEVLIEADGISLALGGRPILDGVTTRVRRGEIVTLIGPNGAGKTTVVRVLLGLAEADRGRVRRRDGLVVGYMPQRLHVDRTLPLTVGRFLELGLVGTNGRRRRSARPGPAPGAVLDEVGTGALLETPIQDVSGGEFQRVLLARALLRDPDLLVLDEPSQGIDVIGQAELYGLIRRIREKRGCGVLMVSHDLHLVMAETDEVVCLNHHVCCAGHPETVANDPAYIALFGKQVAGALAVYHHEHDHAHDGDGAVVPLDGHGTDAEGHHHRG